MNASNRDNQLPGACGDCCVRDHCIIHCLPASERKNIRISRKQFSKGSHLLHQGDKVRTLYTLRSGCAKSFTNTADGEEPTQQFYFPGDTVGLNAFVTQESPVNVVTLQDCAVCSYDLSAMQRLNRTTAAAQDYILKSFAGIATQAYQLSLVTSAEKRVAAFFTQLAERQKSLGYSRAEFLLPMSRLEIANYLRLAHETVSRVLSGFKRKQFLDIKDRSVHILCYEKLSDLAEGSRL